MPNNRVHRKFLRVLLYAIRKCNAQIRLPLSLLNRKSRAPSLFSQEVMIGFLNLRLIIRSNKIISLAKIRYFTLWKEIPLLILINSFINPH